MKIVYLPLELHVVVMAIYLTQDLSNFSLPKICHNVSNNLVLQQTVWYQRKDSLFFSPIEN